MKLKDIIKFQLQLNTKEFKARLQNKQIKINGRIITNEDLEADNWSGFHEEFGEFIFQNIEFIQANPVIKLFNIEDLFGDEEQTNVEVLRFFEAFDLLTLSKKDKFVLFRN